MKNKIVIFIVICLVSSCQKQPFEIFNLNNNKISILGHGGMGIGNSYPMNSFESILNCLNLGADGSEIDVQMTKDGVLVAFHDSLLDISTNASGQISDKLWDEIKNVKYKNPIYSNYKLLSLDELFTNIPNLSKYTFFLHCQNYNGDTTSLYLNTFSNAISNIIDKHNLNNNVYIEFTRRELIISLKSLRPDLKIFIYYDFEVALKTVNEFQLHGISIHIDQISKEQVKKAHDNGTMIAVSSIHSQNKNIEAVNKNVDFVQTDKVKHLISILK